MSLFRLVAKLGIDSTEFSAGLKQAESGMQASMASIGKYIAGAFSIAAITAFSLRVAKVAGDIGDLADQLGITTEEVQKLQRAADHSGVSFDKYASTLGKIRKLKSDAAAGDQTALGIFGRTGLNAKDDDFSLLKQIGGLSDAKAFEILDAKSARLKNSLKDINSITPMELIDDETISKLDAAGDKVGDIKRAIDATGAKGIAKGSSVTADTMRGMGIVIDEFLSGVFGMKSMMELRNNGKALAVPKVTKKQELNREIERLYRDQTRSIQSPLDEAEEAMNPKKKPLSLSRIYMGDRANVGGFFGPNADLNSKMQRLNSNVETMAKSMQEIAKVVKGETSMTQ